MALNYDLMMTQPPLVRTQSYTVRDTMLYALGAGAALGAPTDPDELRFVYEDGLEALPTMAAVLGSPGFWLQEPQYGVNWKQVLHGEQRIIAHRPLPVTGTLIGKTTVDAIYDKGPDKGALLCSTRTLIDGYTGELIASVSDSAFLRGDGGFGGMSQDAPKPHSTPVDRAPDAFIEFETRPEQALIYRLSGDYNPLHADPVVARDGGFDRPILHGLCTYAIAGRGALKLLCGGQARRLKRFDARFSSPVYPGERLRVEVWREGTGRAGLRVVAVERDQPVLKNGFVEFEA